MHCDISMLHIILIMLVWVFFFISVHLFNNSTMNNNGRVHSRGCVFWRFLFLHECKQLWGKIVLMDTVIFVWHMLRTLFGQIEIVVPQQCTCNTSKYYNHSRLVGYVELPKSTSVGHGTCPKIPIAKVWFHRLTFPKNPVVLLLIIFLWKDVFKHIILFT